LLFITKEEEIILKDKIVSLYFYGSWMPFHKKMMIMLDKMEEKYKDILFLGIDVDFFKNVCRRFSISSVPTIVILNNGLEIKRIEGLVMTSALKSTFVEIHKDKNGKEK
jgi:thiol-disulfide isomerase/thioredoxin